MFIKKSLALLTLCLFSNVSWSDSCRGDCWAGTGTETYANGDSFTGRFFQGQVGYGTKTYSNGDKYAGFFHEGKYEGTGTKTYSNGDEYVGSFDEGKYSGIGTKNYADGRIIEGAWKEGEYYSTSAQREIEQEKQREKRETAEKIYNACLLDKSVGIDMQVRSLKRAVEQTCRSISRDPTWFESFKYN